MSSGVSLRGLRACLVCSYVQTSQKFQRTGCPNCEEFLEMRNSSEVVAECTSEVFEGVITLTDTTSSWVAKWQRIQGYVPGVYAIKINGILSEEYVAAVENAGRRYVPRDGSVNHDEQ